MISVLLVITLPLILITTRTTVIPKVLAKKPPSTEVIGNSDIPCLGNLSLYVLYGNGTLVKNAVWENIEWANVNRVGIRNDYGIGGFEKGYGSILWYPDSLIDDKIYSQPLWFIFIRFWAKTGDIWYKNYITIETQRTPIFNEIEPSRGNFDGEWEIGWNGTVIYNTLEFPVYVGLRVNRDSSLMKIKTNVTTPIDLQDHAIEYQLYLNPYWVDKAEKNVKWVRVHYVNDTHKDFDVAQAMSWDGVIPEMVYSLSFLDESKNVEINTFDFADVFDTTGTRLAKIEEVTLPNEQTTYVIKIGATYGTLEASGMFTIDPSLGFTTKGVYTSDNINRIEGSDFTMTENGIAVTMTVYLKQYSILTPSVKCAIYDSSLNVVGSTDEWTLTAGWDGWKTFNFSGTPELTASDTYTFVWWSDNYITFFFNTSWTGHHKTETYNGWPNPIVAWTSDTTRKLSIYCNYTSNTAPTVSSFAVSDATVLANKYFSINATGNDANGITQIVNMTMELNGSLILKWDNATATFSISSDPSSYAAINTSDCVEREINSTAFEISWNIKLNNYPAGSIDIINSTIHDGTDIGSNSATGVFTFSYCTLSIQGRGSSSINLPRVVTFSGTMGNGTSFSDDSNTNGLLSLTTCYGSHTISVQWGTHSIGSSSPSVTSATQSVNIDTKIERLNDGSNYILFSLNDTTLPTCRYVSATDLRFDSVTTSGTIELKLDNKNWKETGQPIGLTVGEYTYDRANPSWSWDSTNKIFSFPCPFSVLDIKIVWETPIGPGGPISPPSPPYIPPEPIEPPEDNITIPIPIIPYEPIGAPEQFVMPSQDLTNIGIVMIVIIVVVGTSWNYIGKFSENSSLWRNKRTKKKKKPKWRKKQ